MAANDTNTNELLSTVNITGHTIRGKRVSTDWQVHRAGCADGTKIKNLQRGLMPVMHTGTMDELRDQFNAEMGPGGSAGFSEEEGGWDFDRDVHIAPCATTKKTARKAAPVTKKAPTATKTAKQPSSTKKAAPVADERPTFTYEVYVSGVGTLLRSAKTYRHTANATEAAAAFLLKHDFSPSVAVVMVTCSDGTSVHLTRAEAEAIAAKTGPVQTRK